MDWDQILKLVQVVDVLRGHPNLKPLADAALHELDMLANPPVEIVDDEEGDRADEGETNDEETTEDE